MDTVGNAVGPHVKVSSVYEVRGNCKLKSFGASRQPTKTHECTQEETDHCLSPCVSPTGLAPTTSAPAPHGRLPRLSPCASIGTINFSFVVGRIYNRQLPDGRPSTNLVAARSAELLSDAFENLIRESRVLHGASEYHATEQRRCPKDGFFPVPIFHGKNFLQSP